jgi:hypothetical protein
MMFEIMKKKSVEFVVALSVFAGSRTAVYSLSSDWRCLAGAEVQWVGEWVGIQRLQPSQNVSAGLIPLVWGRAGVNWGGWAMNRGWGVNGELPWVLTVSSVMLVGCTTRAAAKRLVCRGFGANRVVGTRAGGVLLGLVKCPVVSELRAMVQSGVGQGVELSSMTWQVRWTCEASWRARAA